MKSLADDAYIENTWITAYCHSGTVSLLYLRNVYSAYKTSTLKIEPSNCRSVSPSAMDMSQRDRFVREDPDGRFSCALCTHSSGTSKGNVEKHLRHATPPHLSV
jgi:hypothetical protein